LSSNAKTPVVVDGAECVVLYNATNTFYILRKHSLKTPVVVDDACVESAAGYTHAPSQRDALRH